MYLDKIGGRLAISMPSRVGGRVLANSTAGGKAMLAWLAPECVGAAIRGPECPVAAVSLCGDNRTAPLERVSPLVLDATRKIALALHPELSTGRPAPRPAPAETWSPGAQALQMPGQRSGWI
ncbi:hypothetical protein ACFWPA_15535 [Rhodococcus sp. NPDC058505]|uniref:hypothetical protein n=1 Tax=Rhodococcus sp. NPDC058505 TaxID=3346531 RepID=UPI0036657879